MEDSSHSLRIATFNCEWRRTQSGDASLIRERVFYSGVDIVCLTETHHDFMDDCGGYTVASTSMLTGVGTKTRRKVLLWSRTPWCDVDTSGPPGIPEARYVAATTQTSLGAIRIVGVVIPYSFAGVQYGEVKLRPWELHIQYLDALDASVSAEPTRTVLLGDFNQRVPRKHQPSRVFKRLEEVLISRFELATAGALHPLRRQSIDHICVSKDLSPVEVSTIDNERPGGGLISDHFGVRTLVKLAA
ncbi:endonuclease/exonuclease/phosphatase family protein [Sphingomonas kaistensis]|uniref:endonuclease/exonuclease/phosphatase family protein n=1 Tax=Sphingomonas kaistensis TaxID=298708 RepID=UPI0014388616